MQWIALQPSTDKDLAWRWRALAFTPRVAAVDEALLLEVSASERLFGGRRKLLRRLLGKHLATTQRWATGPTSLTALASLRLLQAGEVLPVQGCDDFPLTTLTAAREHAPTLERTGCRSWGQLKALPRAGVSRRFGAALLQALDAAYGLQAERYPWLTLPEIFDQKLELPEQATAAPELMWAAQRLLTLLQLWLQGRNRGVLALELEWVHGLRRLDGRTLPPTASLQLRTAEPTQDMRHLRRLAAEQLARTPLAAPATDLRLRSLETVPWGGLTVSLLPEERRTGEQLHQLIERLSVRLGPDHVTRPLTEQDHRPERMQRWVPARDHGSVQSPQHDAAACADDLLPSWLLRDPRPLVVKANKPWYQGPLQLVSRARRLEAGWWDGADDQPAKRDYFIAQSEAAGLLWVYREHLAAGQNQQHWFLHGIYA